MAISSVFVRDLSSADQSRRHVEGSVGGDAERRAHLVRRPRELRRQTSCLEHGAPLADGVVAHVGGVAQELDRVQEGVLGGIRGSDGVDQEQASAGSEDARAAKASAVGPVPHPRSRIFSPTELKRFTRFACALSDGLENYRRR
jgi:hypothetical protein